MGKTPDNLWYNLCLLIQRVKLKKGLKKEVVEFLFKNRWKINKIARFTQLLITEIEDIMDNRVRVIDSHDQIKALFRQQWTIDEISQVMHLSIETIREITG
jgi:AraC-like DNA-binding protein